MTMSATESVRANYKVRASELVGRNWLNTGGKQLDLEALRGKIVLLDFWSFCCINCLHVLDELRPLEEKYSDVLVTVGVHSPKFEHEADPDALAAAVERYEIHHPILDDPELTTWQAYGARAWPTLVVLDPEGYIVAHLSGEGHAQGLGSLVEELITEHEAKGTLHRGNGPYVAPEAVEGDLRFPGKAIALANGNLLIGDSGHHRLVELADDLSTVVRTIGSGVRGYADGDANTAQFNELQGLTALPQELAAKVGYDVVVADTVNHRLRSVNLSTGVVGTLAGNGVQRLLDSENARQETQAVQLGTDALNISLSSPWDVLFHPSGQIIIAMAGTHQIFAFDPETNAVSIFAGTGLEGLKDGKADEAWFAQSSGLALEGENVWIADSETSALRWIEVENGEVKSVNTAVGTGLFDFGFRDGEAEQARLQHPLGVAVLPDRSIAIADSYNGAVRRFDPATKTVSTLAKGLKEPADVLVDSSVEGDPVLLVVETNSHQLVRVPIPAEALVVDEGASQTQRPKTKVQAGKHDIVIRFAAPKGQKLDDRWGDPTQLKISSSPAELLLDGGGTSVGLTRTLQLNPEVADGVLHITARAAACDGEPGGEIPDHAACHLYQQDWGIPVLLDPEGDDELLLDLRGVN
ncbi:MULTISPECIES: NHL domain-containing thioredoxin family protein [Micrococcaceae]|uniref:NHL domain-containing thioredoxin family protein n=2 Tax=Micrococcaceae TaxID=1268 RepID=UPI001A918906|nr:MULTISPECIES: NHL domain-containing thioredoxin family protein [Micrococcaceae]UXN33122.1 NHL domain-containing thioredoxin family protein [Glutamicibacter sp. M10]